MGLTHFEDFEKRIPRSEIEQVRYLNSIKLIVTKVLFAPLTLRGLTLNILIYFFIDREGHSEAIEIFKEKL